MLKDKINADYMTAFKAKDTVKKNLLSVIKGGIQLGEKHLMVENMPDDKVLEILNQAAKACRETISKLEEGELKEFAKIELAIIESYLPKQMTSDEIRDKVQALIKDGASNIAEVMRAFSTLPADRKEVAQIYNELK
jgi:uncharacterized protein YqeY